MASEFKFAAMAAAICAQSGYRLIRPVGRGAFKETFEILDGDGRPQALKLLAPGEMPSPRVVREIEASRLCQHPNIVAAGTVAELSLPGGGSCVYLIEEFLAGGTLQQFLERGGRLDPQRLRTLALPLVSAIAHLASVGIVHRDLKPANIMLRRPNELDPVIVDFGIVRALAHSSLTASELARGPGTPYFAPPEQLVNDKHLVDWRADQFSLGVVLSLAWRGLHPYQHGESETPGEVVHRVAERGALASWVTEQNDVPQLARMVRPWPVQRYRRAADLAGAWGLTTTGLTTTKGA